MFSSTTGMPFGYQEPKAKKPRQTSNDNIFKGPSEIQVVITPQDFDHRIDRLGRPYAWIRASMTYRKREYIRTIMAQDEAYYLIQHLLGVGHSLKISGFKERIVDKESGKPGAEIFRAQNVIKVFDDIGDEIDGSTGAKISAHNRSGHYRRQHYGPENSQVKIIWVDDCKVKGGKKAS